MDFLRELITKTLKRRSFTEPVFTDPAAPPPPDHPGHPVTSKPSASAGEGMNLPLPASFDMNLWIRRKAGRR